MDNRLKRLIFGIVVITIIILSLVCGRERHFINGVVLTSVIAYCIEPLADFVDMVRNYFKNKR